LLGEEDPIQIKDEIKKLSPPKQEKKDKKE